MSRTERPTSSFRPCSDSVGIADELSTRSTTDWPARRGQLGGKRLAQQRLVPGPARRPVEAVKPPEAIVDGIHLNARGRRPLVLIGDKPFHHDERRGPSLPESAALASAELLAEESRRQHDVIGLAEPLQNQIAQARAHRHADHQRAGEHRDGNRHTGDDGEVGPPVVAEAAAKKCGWRIGRLRDTLQLAIAQLEADRKPRGKLGAVRHDDQNRVLLLLQLEQERGDRVGRFPIEIARRLVAQQQTRPSDQRARQRHALLLTSGQLSRAMIDAVA